MSARPLSVLASNVEQESRVNKRTSVDSIPYNDYAKFLALLLVLGCTVLNATLRSAQGKRHQLQGLVHMKLRSKCFCCSADLL